MLRRNLFTLTLPLVLLTLAPMPPAAKSAAPVKVTTHTYKRVGKLAIKADLHRVADASVRPVVVWIHGGALINGHRGGIVHSYWDLSSTTVCDAPVSRRLCTLHHLSCNQSTSTFDVFRTRLHSFNVNEGISSRVTFY